MIVDLAEMLLFKRKVTFQDQYDANLTPFLTHSIESEHITLSSRSKCYEIILAGMRTDRLLNIDAGLTFHLNSPTVTLKLILDQGDELIEK